MIYVAAALAAWCFLMAMRALKIVQRAAAVMDTTLNATKAARDAGLSDADRERLLQRASLTLMVAFVSITWRTAVALAASLIPLLGLQLAGVVPLATVGDLLATWQGIALSCGVMAAAYFIKIPA